MSTQTETENEQPIEQPIMTAHPPAEQRVIIHNVSWQSYESLLADFASQSSPRLTYDQGTLEIMTPLREHERAKHIIEIIIELIAEKLELDLECLAQQLSSIKI